MILFTWYKNFLNFLFFLVKAVKVSVGEGKSPNVLVCLNFSSGWYSFWNHTILTRIVYVKPKRNNTQHLSVLRQQTDILVNIRDLLVSQRQKKERLRLRLPFANFKSLIWKQDDNLDLWSLLGWMMWMFTIGPFCCLSLELWQCSTFCTHVLTEICFLALKRKISINSYSWIKCYNLDCWFPFVLKTKGPNCVNLWRIWKKSDETGRL